MQTVRKPSDVLDEIKALLNIRFNDLQSFDELKNSFQVGVVSIVSGSKVVLLEKNDKHLRFRTLIEPGADRGFVRHWHDCKEVCTVLEGQMADLVQIHKRASAGQQIIYKPYEQHMPYNPGKTVLEIQVDFYRE